MMEFLSGDNMVQAVIIGHLWLCVKGYLSGRHGPELTGKERQERIQTHM